MTAAYHRLVFTAACMGLILGLVLVAEWQSWWVALVVGVVGLVVATGLAQDWDAVASADRDEARAAANGRGARPPTVAQR